MEENSSLNNQPNNQNSNARPSETNVLGLKEN